MNAFLVNIHCVHYEYSWKIHSARIKTLCCCLCAGVKLDKCREGGGKSAKTGGGFWLLLGGLVSPMGWCIAIGIYKVGGVLLLSFVLGFTNEEYLIATVDFIAPCGGTKGQRRRTLRIPPSLSGTTQAWFSGLQLFHRTTQAWFRGTAAAGHYR